MTPRLHNSRSDRKPRPSSTGDWTILGREETLEQSGRGLDSDDIVGQGVATIRPKADDVPSGIPGSYKKSEDLAVLCRVVELCVLFMLAGCVLGPEDASA